MAQKHTVPCSCCKDTVEALEAKISELEQVLATNHQLARTDPLTGLPNRRAFDEKIDVAIHAGETFSVAIIDLDHFKSVNDTHGHPVGDAVLRQLGAILTQTSRATDFVARIGGEEFAIILPGASPEANYAYVERVRMAIEENLVVTTEEMLRVSGTASIGMTTRKHRDEGYATMFARADSALYAAKQNGRNRVHHAELHM